MFLTERCRLNIELARMTYPELDDPMLKLQYTLYVKVLCKLASTRRPYVLKLLIHSDSMLFDKDDKKVLYNYLMENPIIGEIDEIKEMSRTEYKEGELEYATDRPFRNG